jgi:hypothetical protein
LDESERIHVLGEHRSRAWKWSWRPAFVGPVWPAVLRLIPVLALLVTSVLLYSSSGDDDAHITYWASYSLVHHNGIYNYNGERVEQSSSMLQVLLLAAAARLTGVDIVTLGKLSSIVFGALTILVVYELAGRVHPRAAFPAALLAATSSYFGYWTVGGMETTMTPFLGLLTLLVVGDLLYRPPASRWTWIGLSGLILAFLLARPETALVLIGVLVGAGIWIWLFHRQVRREWLPRLLLALGLTVLVALAITVFRGWYFGSLLPQPVAAKAGHFSLDDLVRGAAYLQRNFYSLGKTAALAGAALLGAAALIAFRLARSSRPQPHLLLMLAYTGVYLAFVVLSGGDWMEGGRFIAVFIPAVVALFPIAVAQVSRSGWVMALAVLGLLVLQIKTISNTTNYLSSGMPAWERIQFKDETLSAPYSYFERQNRDLVKDFPFEVALKDWVARISALKGPRERVIIYGGQMGFIPYHLMPDWYGKVWIYDRFALVERSFTECTLTRHLPRLTTGVQLDYDYYFRHVAEINSECGIPLPDLIVDIRKRDMELVAQSGYTVVYFIYGKVPGDGRQTFGPEVKADEFIAVRNDWLEQLGPVEPVRVEFCDLLGQ